MPTRMKLTDIDLINVLSSPSCSNYFKEFKEKKYTKKEILFTPKEQDNFAFLIKSGKVRVYLVNEYKEFTLSILRPGDIFSTHTRTFCQALEDTTILVTDIQVLRKIIADIPDVALVMVHVLGVLLKNSITIINGLAFKEVRLRLVEFLIYAVEDIGIQVPEGIQLDMGMSTEDIANMIGSSRQTVSTILSDLQKMEILEKVNRHTYLIKDLKKLKDLVHECDDPLK
ncbi:Crp/Fnr family transcriptional regulator [Microaerobacter geothermalis]|uniref:Crp/Fnr family transcriptional regulator n=1 Tax=Microaerobacter geothermalis TaxID=674972 RepID=UPI001F3549BD|nr:Crp/Fnr family transcriptional regulator [Microaerobacter geothermalis]MCF6092730.1 Crp/Fnr family transcriptional regulator [Microaerobacter geothermalis]